MQGKKVTVRKKTMLEGKGEDKIHLLGSLLDVQWEDAHSLLWTENVEL